MSIVSLVKDIYWSLPLLPEAWKTNIFYWIRGKIFGIVKRKNDVFEEYVDELMISTHLNNEFSIKFPKEVGYERKISDPKIIAFYLPQYYPDSHNDKWWGRGSTEWTNTTKTVPQYLGQYQPRLPGELGFYDLRIKDNQRRQVELAKMYGIYGFCFYYYWFNGERLLDMPLDNFVNDKKLIFLFRYVGLMSLGQNNGQGASNEVLIAQPKDVNSYKKFIDSCLPYFKHKNYIKINGKILLTIYRPDSLPNESEVLKYWRDRVKNEIGCDLYLVASIGNEKQYNVHYVNKGWDAASEFSPGQYVPVMKDITREKQYVCKIFQGKVFDYREFVETKKYVNFEDKKIYKAVCPMLDNTPRKLNRAAVFHGADPDLFKIWLKDIILFTKNNKSIDDDLVFVNAWNEWAEGAYLEPDLKWKYKYLEAVRDAIFECRESDVMKQTKHAGGVVSCNNVCFAEIA